jgi:hypothetical protein
MVLAAACQTKNHYSGYQQTHPVRSGHIFHLNILDINSVLPDSRPIILFFIGSIMAVLNNSMLPNTFFSKKLCTYPYIGS